MRKKKNFNKKFISAKTEHLGGSTPHKKIRKLNQNPEKLMMINEGLLNVFFGMKKM
jgi:hypothetical protein